VLLLPDKFNELHINGKRADNQVDWYVNGVVHHLPLFDGALDVLLAVLHFVAIKVDEAVVVAELHKLLIAHNEAIPRHLKNVDLLADQAGQLPGGLPFTLIRGGQGLGLDGRPQTPLTQAVSAE
jgi:hypothetical protein